MISDGSNYGCHFLLMWEVLTSQKLTYDARGPIKPFYAFLG